MMNVIKISCPSCMASLAEDDLYTNVLHCRYCGSYNYFDKGIYNKNVFFGLVGSKTSTYDGLKEILIKKLTDKGISAHKREIQHICIERFLLPVREFVSNNTHTYVSMLETNADEVGENKDIRDFFEKNLEHIEILFSMNTIRPLRLSHLQDVADTKGHVYKTHILPASKSKYSIDEAYNINPKKMLHILYIPVYRLSFKDNGKTFVCMGDDSLTGLSIYDLVKKDSDWVTNLGINNNDKELLRLALKTSLIIACMITVGGLVYTIKLCNESDSNLFFSLIASVIITLVIPTFTLFVPIYVFLSSFLNTISTFMNLRKRMLRKLLVNIFGYKAQIK